MSDDHADAAADGGESASVGARDDPLAEAVAEHPAEVARFVERLGLVNELLDATELATAALDDRMVEEVSSTGATLAAAADAAATEETARLAGAVGENGDDLAAALETVARLQRDGTLDALVELGDAIVLAEAALDDGMVTELASTGARLGEVADAAADEHTARELDRVLTALGEAGTEDPDPVGAVGLLRALRDPEVRAGLGYLVAVSGALGRTVPDDSG